jgi:taurine dioxygenase
MAVGAGELMEVVAVSGALGAELRGVDLRNLDDTAFAVVRRALVEHEAFLTDEEHLALGARFGTINIFPMSKLLGVTEPKLQVIIDGPDSRPAADDWHTDVTWIATPPDISILRATVIPERGGDTLWSSTTAAYEALSPTTQAFVQGLMVRHDNTAFIRGMLSKMPHLDVPGGLPDQLRAAYPPVEHPLVRTHPESGRQALFLGGDFMRSVVGLQPHESDALLGFLRRHSADARYVCRWRWRAGDVAIWDERSTNHRSAGDHFPQNREVRRCETGGERPVFDATAIGWPRAFAS